MSDSLPGATPNAPASPSAQKYDVEASTTNAPVWMPGKGVSRSARAFKKNEKPFVLRSHHRCRT